jgi:hypothetical protein
MTVVRVKCNRLLKEGRLIHDDSYKPTFADYALDCGNGRPASASKNGITLLRRTPTTAKRT